MLHQPKRAVNASKGGRKWIAGPVESLRHSVGMRDRWKTSSSTTRSGRKLNRRRAATRAATGSAKADRARRSAPSAGLAAETERPRHGSAPQKLLRLSSAGCEVVEELVSTGPASDGVPQTLYGPLAIHFRPPFDASPHVWLGGAYRNMIRGSSTSGPPPVPVEADKRHMQLTGPSGGVFRRAQPGPAAQSAWRPELPSRPAPRRLRPLQ